jgi:Co/Zn/Cd efflux system component
MVSDPVEEEMSLMNEHRDYSEITSRDSSVRDNSSMSMSNHGILRLSAILFALFVIAEVIGALASGSLSLLGDASAMAIDVLTYLANLYAEHLKYTNYHSPRFRRIVFDILVPAIAVATLLGVTGWIASEAIRVIYHSSDNDDVPISYLFGFSIANLAIDVVCNLLFFTRGVDVFYHQPQVIETHYSAIETENIELGSISNEVASKPNGYVLKPVSHNRDRNVSSHVIRKDLTERSAVLESSDAIIDYKYDSLGTTSSPLLFNPVAKRRWNLNMWSAFAHISGDTVRTLSVLTAAIISTTTGFDSALCDAWAAIICSLTIIVIAAVLINELRKTSISIEESNASEQSEQTTALSPLPFA